MGRSVGRKRIAQDFGEGGTAGTRRLGAGLGENSRRLTTPETARGTLDRSAQMG